MGYNKNLKSEKLSSNMEDYLEAIAILEERKRIPRVKDLSDLMNVKRPSVTSALNLLSQKGLVVHEKYGYIQLTDKGRKTAQRIYERHKTLIKFLIQILKVDKKIAEEDACRIEHAISQETFKKLLKFVETAR